MAKFTRSEFTCKCGCGENLIKGVFVSKLNVLGSYLPFPVVVSSGYRCPQHNARESKTGLSGPHTTGEAADLLVSRQRAHTLLTQAARLGFSGIGVKQKGGSRFIHLDTLPNSAGQPRPTIWSY